MNAIRSFNTADGSRDAGLQVDVAYKDVCLEEFRTFLNCHTEGGEVRGYSGAVTALGRLVNHVIQKAESVGLIPALEWARDALKEAVASDERYAEVNVDELFASFIADVYVELHNRSADVTAMRRHVMSEVLQNTSV
ncbi:MAG: hypothetical protein US89_C0005G0046 [Candidatus Peregrinibacteria bacterium GW2011_GWF2_38_29]|nr:MAG: hypothetical protein US89_C0005G0046 [Candidatus Peregrinibacteria bacterium GW2011_GWF2_38_29]HBB02633.1 hypothetical protein [Candidatus Peregrinibacteria bacterium]